MSEPASASDVAVLKLPQGGPTLRVGVEVVRQMQARVTGGLQAVPRRGAEVGGLLLGAASPDGREIAIDAERELECEHRFGPSFLLSDHDREAFTAALAAAQGGAVGLYRSHTRDGDLLHPDDLALASSAEGLNLLAVVQPDGLWRSVCHVFLRGARGRWRHAGAFSLPDADLVAGPAPEPAPERTFGRRLATAPIAAGLVVAAALSLGGWLLWKRGASPRTPAAGAAAVHATPPLSGLELGLERAGGDLKLTWNRGAPAVQQAAHGRFYIRDGASSREVELDADQVRSGNLLYVGGGAADALFRLEVTGTDGRTTSESVRIIAGRGASGGPRQLVVRRESPEPQARGEAAREGEPGPPPQQPQNRPAPRPFTPAQSPATAAQESLPPAPAPPAASIALSPAPLLRTPSGPAAPPAAARTTAPATAPASGPPGDAIEQARVLRQVHPSPPPNVRAMLTRDVVISVQAVVDETGKVIHAIPSTPTNVVERMLAAQAVEAARNWRFHPARRNGAPVTSNVELLFRFRR